MARRLFTFSLWRGSRERFRRRFLDERQRIQSLVERCPESKRPTRVLIPRPRGLEDSSRHWSVWMVLDHLRITNDAMAGIIRELGAGKELDGAASTAAVKPSPDVTGTIEAAFVESGDRVLESAACVSDLRTAGRFAHPWFGRLDAHGWFALVALHTRLHRGQIEKILAGLEE